MAKKIRADIEICKRCPFLYSYVLNGMKVNTVFFCEKKDAKIPIGSEMTTNFERYMRNDKFFIPTDCDYRLEQLVRHSRKK